MIHSSPATEIFQAVVLVLLLFSAKALLDPQREPPGRAARELMLWLAQGFGVGRIPVAPGTFGSLLGLVWFALLLTPGSWWIFLAGTVLGVALSVRLCEVAEQTLGRKDPGSVVFDEIAAVPVCFVSWLGILVAHSGSLPTARYFFSERTWPLTLGVVIAFRVFDVIKPSPVRQSQALPGGWGVTVDDLLAAVYVNIVVLIVHAASEVLLK